MKSTVFLLFAVISWQGMRAQKPPIDSSAYRGWPEVGSENISSDGKFVSYVISTGYLFNSSIDASIIQSTNGNPKFVLRGASYPAFTLDSRLAVYTRHDSLNMLNLQDLSTAVIPDVASFKLPKKNSDWLAYQRKSSKQLVLRNLQTGEEKNLGVVKAFALAEDGKRIILQANNSTGGELVTSIDLPSFASKVIWDGPKLVNLVTDKSCAQVAFTTEENHKRSIFYFENGIGKPSLLVNDQQITFDSTVELEAADRFSFDGSGLFIKLVTKPFPKAASDAVRLNVWSYRDPAIQSYQLKNLHPQSYKAYINLTSHKLIRLEQRFEGIMANSTEPKDKYELIQLSNYSGSELDNSERSWNSYFNRTPYIVSLRDGRKIPFVKLRAYWVEYSPDENFILYYDADSKNFCTYELSTGIKRNITAGTHNDWSRYMDDHVGKELGHYGAAAWLPNDEAVFLYDQYDIWKVDPKGRRPAVNITNGYGRRHHILFRLALPSYVKSVNSDDHLLVIAFDRVNKNNGYFKTRNGMDPEMLTMGPYIYYLPDYYRGTAPVKAANADIWVVRRQSAKESNNLFATRDFKTFLPLSDVHPERKYNWYTNELHTWKTSYGKTIQGILHKPENFDPSKKYPVIVHYYETLTYDLNKFIKAEPSDGDLNIPWFVSHGYLVFEPDIFVEEGNPGPGALRVVVSAGKYLSTLPYVDASKMGLQGISFGSIETNYIITHTKLFAAACSSSGISDFISGYLSLDGEKGNSNQCLYETGQMRMGATLWDRPDLYIKNSAVMYADKVQTPLLMMHTTGDIRCLFTSAIEFFTALRRLGKTVWMLEYEDGNHGIWGRSAQDFSIRIAQFFDHYLKDAPAPRWMTQGIPARLKGVEDGLQLDYGTKAFKPGLLMHSEMVE